MIYNVIRTNSTESNFWTPKKVDERWKSKHIPFSRAVALAMTDSTEKELTTGSAGSNEVVNSRFSLESLVGALAGAAVGANLYVLVAGRQKKD